MPPTSRLDDHQLPRQLDRGSRPPQPATDPQLRSAAARVLDGAAWLDRHRPGWLHLLDAAVLHLHEQDRCVLGQVYGDFYAAPMTLHEAIAYGFESADVLTDDPDDVALPRIDDEYTALEDAWQALISDRTAATR